MIVLFFLVAGCSDKSDDQAVGVEGASQKIEIYETHLKDGTRCVVLTGFSGGIDCDWNSGERYEKLPEGSDVNVSP